MKFSSFIFLVAICGLFFSCESENSTTQKSTEQTALPAKKNTQKPTNTNDNVLSVNDVPHFLVPGQFDNDLKIVPGEKFGLRQHHNAVLEAGNISIKVQKYMDSRCPPDVNCVRAGDITVVLSIIDGENSRAGILTYPTKEKPNSRDNMNIGNYNLQFLGAVKENDDKTPAAKENNDPKFGIAKENDLLLGFIMRATKLPVK